MLFFSIRQDSQEVFVLPHDSGEGGSRVRKTQNSVRDSPYCESP